MRESIFWLSIYLEHIKTGANPVVAVEEADKHTARFYTRKGTPRPTQPRAENGRFAPVMSEGKRYTVSTMQYDPAAGEK